jgi:tRNA threonylcarbamoyladenosine biosynthesis protein TsaE
MQTVRITDLKDLDRFAKAFAADLRGGSVIGLVGDLGAGKTAFSQRVAKALGVKDDVVSPTFVLMRVYPAGAAAKKRGIERLCHVDAYRLKDEAELYGLGFEEYAGDAGTITLVEWADRTPSLHTLPGYKEITFSFEAGDDDARLLAIE